MPREILVAQEVFQESYAAMIFDANLQVFSFIVKPLLQEESVKIPVALPICILLLCQIAMHHYAACRSFFSRYSLIYILRSDVYLNPCVQQSFQPI